MPFDAASSGQAFAKETGYKEARRGAERNDADSDFLMVLCGSVWHVRRLRRSGKTRRSGTGVTQNEIAQTSRQPS